MEKERASQHSTHQVFLNAVKDLLATGSPVGHLCKQIERIASGKNLESPAPSGEVNNGDQHIMPS
jgi:hypothetical protein